MSDINECSKNGSPYISNCEELHKIVNILPRHTIPFEMDKIPENGIYSIFEKGEMQNYHKTTVLLYVTSCYMCMT